MDYKKEIIKLLFQVTNERALRHIYIVLKEFIGNDAKENKKVA